MQMNCLGVNVVVAGEKVGKTHNEETKTENLFDYCTVTPQREDPLFCI